MAEVEGADTFFPFTVETKPFLYITINALYYAQFPLSLLENEYGVSLSNTKCIIYAQKDAFTHISGDSELISSELLDIINSNSSHVVSIDKSGVDGARKVTLYEYYINTANDVFKFSANSCCSIAFYNT